MAMVGRKIQQPQLVEAKRVYRNLDDISRRDREGITMATFKSRVKRLEREWRFRCWLRDKRFLESLTEEQLEVLAARGGSPEAPEPPPGTSRLDTLERKSLI